MCPRDTSPEAWKVFLEIQRKMSPAEKLRRAFEASAMVRAFAESGMRSRFPDADDREIFLRLARLNLGEELFRKVYGDALNDEPRPARQCA